MTVELKSNHEVQPESSHPVDSSAAYDSARACDSSRQPVGSSVRL